MRRVRVDPISPAVSVIADAAAVILAGGVVAVPTDTLYGLAADPFNAAGVAKVFSLKGRAPGQPLALVASDLDQVIRHFPALGRDGISLARQFWPGPLTLLLESPNGLAEGVGSPDRRVGVRIPAHAVPRALCARCDRPLTATSANPSGHPAPADADGVERALSAALDLLLDAGATPGGSASTIVDVTGEQPRLVRSGAVGWESIRAALK